MTQTQQFARMVRERRNALGLSIEKAAELCGMSYKGLEEIELGDSNPKLSSILSISTALGINLENLNPCVPSPD
ncbi:MAG: helix-turn-helix transcriptional regulator [Ruminococcaceae bacterium]|nr:helix-turn-helix transcriptional regulator [Oscillospiraceae bacterium]